MTIASTARKAGPFPGNGSVTAFPFAFKVFAVDDVLVSVADDAGVETVLVLGTDYTVSLNANQETSPGGTVTYPVSGSPLPNGSLLSIIGDIDYDQPLDLPSGGNYSPLALENQLDRIAMQVQQLKEIVSRTLQLSVNSPAGTSTALPPPQANALIAWNAATNGLQNLDPVTLATVVAFGTAVPDIFTGDGVQTAFTLSANPGALGNLDVAVGGVTQLPGVDYFWTSGTSLTFAEAPADGVPILVRYIQALPQGDIGDGAVFDRHVATSSKLYNRIVREVFLDDYAHLVTSNWDAAFAAALAALGAGGGTIKLSAREYTISSLNLAGRDYITFEGQGGKTQSTIYWTATTGNVVDLTGCRFVTFRHINFLPTAQKTAGTLFHIPAGATDIYFEHIRVSSGYRGWDINGDNIFFKHVEALDYNTAWPWDFVMRVGNATQAAFISIDDFIIQSQTVFTAQAVIINNVDTFLARALFVQKQGAGQMVGVYITGGEFIQFHQCHMESGSATTEGFLIAGGANINLIDCHATTSLYGIRITGGAGIEVIGGRSYYNARNGIRIEGGKHILVEGVSIPDNSTVSSGAWDAIYVAAGVSDFRLVNNAIGTVRGTPVQCRYGINVVDGASDRYVITGNTITDFAVAAVYDGGTGARRAVTGNTHGAEDYPLAHAVLTTTDAAAATLWSLGLLDESGYYITATVVAQSADTSVRAAYTRTCLVYRDGGTAVIQGQTSVDALESNAALDCVFDTSVNAVRLRVTGLAGTTMRWRARIEISKSTTTS